MSHFPPLQYAVDIGNSRIKIGEFLLDSPTVESPLDSMKGIREPVRTLELYAKDFGHDEAIADALATWLSKRESEFRAHAISDSRWTIASVNWPLTARLSGTVEQLGVGCVVTLGRESVPIQLNLTSPETVGIDRMLAAVAANRMRNPSLPAIVVDLGTAITVDLISDSGVFEGGAIMPGLITAARALDEQTDALPFVKMMELKAPPEPLGKSTVTAIESGIFWGAVGAIRELTNRYLQSTSFPGAAGSAHPDFYLTGGAASLMAHLFEDLPIKVHHVPHLVLLGILESRVI